MPLPSDDNSLETILRLDGTDGSIGSEWSTQWSTTNVPGMDTGYGARGTRRRGGRRYLRFGALAVGGLLTMHCRVGASAISGGYFIFLIVLIPAVALMANPMRHFEIYLGQWSLSGPGRAFRILPMLDGIGIAICINAILRSIIYVTLAAICAIYLFHTTSDETFPYDYCRTFNLSKYDAAELKTHRMRLVKEASEKFEFATVGISEKGWRNYTKLRENSLNYKKLRTSAKKLKVCNETFSGKYPALPRTPSFNYFYIDVMQLRPGLNYKGFNLKLFISLSICWLIIWLKLISERIKYGKLIWNNANPTIMYIPWIWALVLLVSSMVAFHHQKKSLFKGIKLQAKETITALTDAFEVAIYIHSASSGTEVILGKGLNHFASGHIDPRLNGENVWHSVILLALVIISSSGSSICALLDFRTDAKKAFETVVSSTLFSIPIYARCTSLGPYSHFRSSLMFLGLGFAYLYCAFVFLKTALHTIFEYKVKLVFWEQLIVAALIMTSFLLSLFFTTQGGLPLLESLDAVITGIGMPFICLMELVAFLYVYQSSDFISDMNIATEENSCSTRISKQWVILPFVVLVFLLLKIIALCNTELPLKYMFATLIPISLVVLSVPIRSCHNAYVFLRPAPRYGT